MVDLTNHKLTMLVLSVCVSNVRHFHNKCSLAAVTNDVRGRELPAAIKKYGYYIVVSVLVEVVSGLRSKFYVSLSKDEVSGVFWMSFITFKFDYNRQKEKKADVGNIWIEMKRKSILENCIV